MQTFEEHKVVEQGDLDNLDHVNNVRYVQWVQDIAERHWKSKITDEIESNFFWVLIDHHIQYKNAAKLGDVLKVVTYVEKAEAVTTLRVVEFYDENTDLLLAKSKTKWVFMSKTTLKPTRITPEVFELFS
ncbi:acyl-CoA thioester hydrolase [Flavobacteriaceae bacterium MAR_2010_188]|nr:acyl-CoA thioester hydrolase [Flavobacteriaceae bacterium MAR_2010_188]